MPLEALRSIVDPRRVVSPSGDTLKLTEEAATSTCPPLHVRADVECWALRLSDRDYLPFLAELPKPLSVRRLPDFLLFSEPHSEEVALHIAVCEFKSSEAGAEDALPQIRLGRLLADYLLSLTAHRLGTPEPLKTWSVGLLVSPELPTSLISRGKTRPGKVEPPNFHDKQSKMRIHMSAATTDLWLSSLY